MKIFNMVLIILLIFMSFTGCTDSADMAEETQNSSMSQADAEKTGLAPEVTVDLEGPEFEQDQEQNSIITIDCMEFYFDMQMDTALEVLENCAVEYEISDDMSTVRSWAGTCIAAKGLSLYFDIDEKLHEIRISVEQKTNLPVKIGDLVSDITNDLGEKRTVLQPGISAGCSCNSEQ